MLRTNYTFVCTLFALLFLFGFQPTSHAARVQASGSFLDSNGTYVALYFSGSDVRSGGSVSLTTAWGHIYAPLNSVSISPTDISLVATAWDGSALITGTMHRDDTGVWNLVFNVAFSDGSFSSYAAPFGGNVYLLR